MKAIIVLLMVIITLFAIGCNRSAEPDNQVVPPASNSGSAEISGEIGELSILMDQFNEVDDGIYRNKKDQATNRRKAE